MADDHGPQIKDDEQYEALRDQGASKEKTAAIANSGKEAAFGQPLLRSGAARGIIVVAGMEAPKYLRLQDWTTVISKIDTMRRTLPDGVVPAAIYTPSRVGALAGVSGYTVGQWARNGLIEPSLYRGRPTHLYGFSDVAEAIAVRWLLDEGFSYKEIHHAIDAAHHDHPQWPLSKADVGIGRAAEEGDRGLIAIRDSETGTYFDATRGRDQTTIRPSFWFKVADILRSGGWIARELGLSEIEVEPGRLGGRPTLRGTRWPIEQVARIAADDGGTEILLSDYGLPRSGIKQSLEWQDAVDDLVAV